MKDLNYELGVAVKTGKLVLGYNKVVDLLYTGKPKLVIMSETTPKAVRESVIYYSQIAGVKCLKTKMTSYELGSSCGKPFPVSSIAVIDAGDSDLLS